MLWLLTAALAFAGRGDRFGATFDRYSPLFLGAATAWLVKSFFPLPEEGDPVSIQALPYVAVYACLAVMLFIAALVGS